MDALLGKLFFEFTDLLVSQCVLHRDADLIRDLHKEIDFVLVERIVFNTDQAQRPYYVVMARKWQHTPSCEIARQQKLPGKMRTRFLATAGPGFGSLDHVSGDRTETGNGGAFLKICITREIESINLELSAFRRLQVNADAIAQNAAPDAHHHAAHHIPRLLVVDGLPRQFEQQFEAGLFAPQFRLNTWFTSAWCFEHFYRPGQTAPGESRIVVFCSWQSKIDRCHENAPYRSVIVE